jgi:hypothetical protein
VTPAVTGLLGKAIRAANLKRVMSSVVFAAIFHRDRARRNTLELTHVIPTCKIIDSSLRGSEADEAIQKPRHGLWIASLRSQ